MKAISTAITTIILISVMLVITIAGVMYIISSIMPIQEKSLETLMIKGDSYISRDGNTYTLHLHLYSNIKPALTLYALEVASKYVKLSSNNVKVVLCSSGKAEITDKGLTLIPGTDVWIEVSINEELNVGNYVNVKLYSETGYVYVGVVTFK